jgi:hypothetical protein
VAATARRCFIPREYVLKRLSFLSLQIDGLQGIFDIITGQIFDSGNHPEVLQSA